MKRPLPFRIEISEPNKAFLPDLNSNRLHSLITILINDLVFLVKILQDLLMNAINGTYLF